MISFDVFDVQNVEFIWEDRESWLVILVSDLGEVSKKMMERKLLWDYIGDKNVYN